MFGIPLRKLLPERGQLLGFIAFQGECASAKPHYLASDGEAGAIYAVASVESYRATEADLRLGLSNYDYKIAVGKTIAL